MQKSNVSEITKYRIKSLVYQHVNPVVVIEELAKRVDVSDRQFRRIMNIPISGKSEATPSQLRIIADYFGLDSIDELINEPAATAAEL